MDYKSGMKIKVNIEHNGDVGFFKDLYQDFLDDNIEEGMNVEEAKDDAIEGALKCILDTELAQSKANDLLLLNGDDDLFATDVVYLDNEEAEFTIKSWN